MHAGAWVYAALMTPERDVPPLRRSQPDSGAQADAGSPGEGPPPAEPQPAEHYGPIAIARHVKDDGRALLLYTHTAVPGKT
jgi:hypothetical protein